MTKIIMVGCVAAVFFFGVLVSADPVYGPHITIPVAHAQQQSSSQYTDLDSKINPSVTTNSFHTSLVCDGFDTVLLIQDNIPWSTLNDPFGANVEELKAQEIDFCLTTSSQIGIINLNQFGEIIISSAQNQRFYNTIFPSGTIHLALTAWVQQGGILSANLYDNASGPGQGGNWDGDTFVAGVQHVNSLFNFNNIADATHPIITGEFGGINGGTIVDVSSNNDLDNWGLSSNGYFVNLPAGTTVILNQPDVTGDGIREPVMIQYPFGDGQVIAGMTSIEWRYVGGFNDRPVNKKLLTNEIGFQNEIAVITVPDLELVDVSPVQVIFDPDFLVDSKKTLLRIEVTSTGKSTLDNVQIDIDIDGTIIPETVSVQPGSNVFFLPSNQFIFPTGSEFVATVDIVLPPSVLEENPDNNQMTINSVVKDTRSLSIQYIPVQFASTAPSDDEINLLKDSSDQFLTGVFPIADSEYSSDVGTLLTLSNSGPIIQRVPLDELFLLVSEIGAAAIFDGFDIGVGVVNNDFFETKPSDPRFSEVRGMTFRDNAGVIVEKENKVGHVTAHEIGHTFELSHVVDLTIVDGFWVEKRCNMGNYNILNQKVPEPCDKNMDAEDLMVESIPSLDKTKTWISKSDFNELITKFKEPFDPDVILISGLIFDDGNVTLNPWYRIESDIDIPLDATGEFSILYLDGSNNVIAQTGLDIARTPSEGDIDTNFGGFLARIPDVLGTERIVIKNGDDVLVERIFSSNSPTVSILSPNGGDELLQGELLTVQWVSSDLDGDVLNHVVSISQDGGSTWNTLSVNNPDNSFTFKVPPSVFSDTILVRVSVTDGINTAQDVSDGFLSVKPFPAGGQRSDVNAFIAFGDPIERSTNLPSGTENFTIIIHYGPTVDPATFSATLNSIDVVHNFNPIPGTFEFVTLPMNDGSNTLKITIEGIRTDGRTATDKDSLVFAVG